MNKKPRRSCTGKVRHKTHAGATIALQKTIERTGDLGLVIYRCRHGRHWHIGHASRDRQKQLITQRMAALIDKTRRTDRH